MAIFFIIRSFISYNLSTTELIHVLLQSDPPQLRRRPLTATPLASSSASTTTAATITTDTTTTSTTTTITRECPAWEESKTTWDGIQCNCENQKNFGSWKISIFRHTVPFSKVEVAFDDLNRSRAAAAWWTRRGSARPSRWTTAASSPTTSRASPTP